MFFSRVLAELQNNGNNSADGVKSNTESITNEAESDSVPGNDSDIPSNNLEVDEV